jgi:hypothetical protein
MFLRVAVGLEFVCAKHLSIACSERGCDRRHCLGHSLRLVQIGFAETGGFYEMVADRSGRAGRRHDAGSCCEKANPAFQTQAPAAQG